MPAKINIKPRHFVPNIFIGFLLYGLIFINQVHAQDTLKPYFTHTAPVIDGIINDEVWTKAPHVTGYMTFAPDFGKKPDEQTIAYMAYDDENLFFAFRCFDQPEKVKKSVGSRDNILGDDWVCINLDSRNDQQGLNCFYINPFGIQADSKFSGGNEDFSPDLVWYSAGKPDSLGYTLEVQIPLKSLRYSDNNPVMMGVVFERYISRRLEHSSYPAMDPAKGLAFLTEMGPMMYPGVKHYTLLEILPAWTYSQRYSQQGGSLVNDEQKGNLSLTGKYGITSDLVLDGTYNPDFSQVESDAGQVDVNLRYSLFYPEKRPFFLEGQDNFTLGATSMAGDAAILDPIQSIVYTRTIVNPLVGVKLAGKVDSRTTLASIFATDRVLEADRPVEGNNVQYPIIRYKRALNDDSYLGAIYAGQESEHHFNRVGGLDEQIRIGYADILESSAFISKEKTDASSPVLDGDALGIRYHHDSRNIEDFLSVRDVSENFHADMGYITRTGVTTITGMMKPKIHMTGLFSLISPDLYSAQTLDKFSNLWETYNQASVTSYFLGSFISRLRYMNSSEIFGGERFQTSGAQLLIQDQFTREVLVNVSYKKKKAIYYDSLSQGKSNIVSATLVYQPYDQFRGEYDFTYSDFTREGDDRMLYNYPISRVQINYQVNQYLFFRGIGEYNNYRNELTTDFLASFTYIPGTVLFAGYGSFYEKLKYENGEYVESGQFLETQRAFFFKASYLWRM